MRTILLTISILLMSATAMAQARPIQPIRLMFVSTTEESSTDKEFADILRDALRARRDVTFTQQEKRADYSVAVATERVTRNNGEEFIGYCAAVLVVESSTGKFKLSVRTAPSIAEVAKSLAGKLDADFKKGAH